MMLPFAAAAAGAKAKVLGGLYCNMNVHTFGMLE